MDAGSESLKKFVEYARKVNGVSETKVLCLCVNPILLALLEKRRHSYEDILRLVDFSKPGGSQVDITIDAGESVLVIELKSIQKKGERDFKSLKESFGVTSGKLQPPIKKEEKEITVPERFRKPEAIFCHITGANKYSFKSYDGDITGQLLRYIMELYEKKRKAMRAVLTNGIEWFFYDFNEELLEKLRQRSQKEDKENCWMLDEGEGKLRIVDYGDVIKEALVAQYDLQKQESNLQELLKKLEEWLPQKKTEGGE